MGGFLLVEKERMPLKKENMPLIQIEPYRPPGLLPAVVFIIFTSLL